MIRDVLLAVYAAGWLAVVLVTVWRTGAVPAELWAALGVGVGGLLAAFKVDGTVGGRTSGARQPANRDPEPAPEETSP
jgi:hypothetical protein